MELLSWNENYSLGIQEIDNQHKQLIELVNELYTAMMTKKTKDSLQKVLEGLVNYTINHFNTEETYFRKFNYSSTIAHVEEHQLFVAKVLEFQNSFNEGKTTVSMEILSFLRDWIVQHILGSDRQFISLFIQNGL